ncbi:MAG TPA: VOC family protein [Leadbetterella sp.]|nr:VOC family protein [Leadbetterella sp.]
MSLKENLISGIQQVGIGVVDAGESFKWYNKNLGLDVPVFDDIANAKLMVRYTNGNIRKRRAILAVNMAGGGGAEIWESKNPLPIACSFEPKLGDLGIFALKIKSQDLLAFSKSTPISLFRTPESKPTAWLKDNYGNQLQLVEDDSWFLNNLSNTGGVLGVILGVRDMDKALKLYKDILGIDNLVYDKTGVFEDFGGLGAADKQYRRVLLRKGQSGEGAFSRLFGNIELELVQAIDTTDRKTIMEGRSWGDLGFIHLCFDALNMDKLGEKLLSNGYPFVVDSANSFDMGDAAGRFTYIEDPDGTLIEFVETHKVPILKKIGWYINLKKRKTQNPLPNWMVKTLGWGRVKM